MNFSGYSSLRELFIKVPGFVSLLTKDPFSKSASVLGRINDKHAVLILEKTAFGDDLHLITNETESPMLKIISGNDIYRWYLASLSEGKFSIKATVIYPATDVHIRKYEKQRRHMVKETPEIYKKHIINYIQTMKGSRLQWLYNILDHKAETEKIIYEDPDPETGFLLLPDMYVPNDLSFINRKWDGSTISSLYLCAIFRRYDLSSIRDLNESHIPLLRTIQNSVIHATTSKWPEVSADQLRMYIHCITPQPQL